MLRRVDEALDEIRYNALVDGDWVRNLLLDLRAEAQMLDAVVELTGGEPALPDLSD